MEDHSIQNVNGDVSKGIAYQESLSKVCNHVGFVSQIEPKEIDEAIIKEHWYFTVKKG